MENKIMKALFTFIVTFFISVTAYAAPFAINTGTLSSTFKFFRPWVTSLSNLGITIATLGAGFYIIGFLISEHSKETLKSFFWCMAVIGLLSGGLEHIGNFVFDTGTALGKIGSVEGQDPIEYFNAKVQAVSKFINPSVNPFTVGMYDIMMNVIFFFLKILVQSINLGVSAILIPFLYSFYYLFGFIVLPISCLPVGISPFRWVSQLVLVLLIPFIFRIMFILIIGIASSKIDILTSAENTNLDTALVNLASQMGVSIITIIICEVLMLYVLYKLIMNVADIFGSLSNILR